MYARTVGIASGFVLFCSLPVMGQLKLSSSDKTFMTLAANVNMTEAHLGQMAQDYGAEPRVKDFGQTLAKDHGTAYGKLLEVADKVHEQIPRGINISRDTDYKQLSHLKGATFDKRFIQDEIREHQKVLAEFKREADHGENADLRNYAKQEIPTIEQHLHDAQNLAKGTKQRS